MNKHKAAGVLVVNNDGLVLGVSRKHDLDNFGLAGGKLDPGETYEQAAIRELKEETGLEAVELTRVFEDFCGDVTRGDVIYYTVTFQATVVGTISTTEAGRVAWITPKKMTEGCFGDYNKKLFDKLGITYK